MSGLSGALSFLDPSRVSCEYEGVVYKSFHHGRAAAKTMDAGRRMAIGSAFNGKSAIFAAGRRSGAVIRDDWDQARDMATENGPHQARGRGLATRRDAAVVRAPKSGGGRGHKGRRRCRKTSND